MQLFKRLFSFRQKQISPDQLNRNIHEFSKMLRPKLWKRELGMIDTIAKADKEKALLLPNVELSRLLNGKTSLDVGFVWSGTLIIFEEAGKPFNSKIEYGMGMFDAVSISFDVPKKQRGFEGGAFVVHHPFFRFSQKNDKAYLVQVAKDKLQFVEGFPAREGRFSVEGFFGLPIEGGEVSRESVHLSLRPSSYIGLIGRSFSNREIVYTTDPPTTEMGAIIKPLIDPQNYAKQIVSILKNGVNRSMMDFARSWADEDSKLRNVLKKEGLL